MDFEWMTLHLINAKFRFLQCLDVFLTRVAGNFPLSFGEFRRKRKPRLRPRRSELPPAWIRHATSSPVRGSAMLST